MMLDEPLALLSGLVWAFAAGMFPVGLMLGTSSGRCSPCCSPCPCSNGELPETLTVTFSGLPDQTQGPDLISLSFLSCFGSGATARVTDPFGDPDVSTGPISAVSLTNGGSGYAKLGRVSPTLSVSGGSGSGATFTPTLSQSQDACNVDRWAVKSVSVSGGSNYIDGEQLTVSIAEGDTEEQAALLLVQTARSAPTLTASAQDGTGAVLAVNITQNVGTPETWQIVSISVTSGGSGYVDGTLVTISLGAGDIQEFGATAYIRNKRDEPTVAATVTTTTGSGAEISAVLLESTDFNNQAVWVVDDITIDQAGSGYSLYDEILITVTDGQASFYSYFYAYVSSVDQDGAVTGITIFSAGEYYKDLGEIDFITIFDNGSYYNDTGTPASVTIVDGGIYYREDPDEEPYVAAVTVLVSPDNQTGANITATVNADTSSDDFGKIASLTIVDGGDGYLAWKWMNTKCCGDYYNGMSVVVKRNNAYIGSSAAQQGPCEYGHRFCGVGNIYNRLGYVRVVYNGPSQPPVVYLVSEGLQTVAGGAASESGSSICNTTFTTQTNFTNCSQWDDAVFTAVGGATATVSAGGEYDATFRNPGGNSCYICCKGEELVTEVTATVSDSRGTGYDYSGDYVLTGGGGYWASALQLDASHAIKVEIFIEPCADQSPSGFSPGDYGCDFCHSKCKPECALLTAAQVSQFGIGGNPIWADENSFAVDEGWYDRVCSYCVDTPLCSPSGMSFSMCQISPFVSGNACGQITVDV